MSEGVVLETALLNTSIRSSQSFRYFSTSVSKLLISRNRRCRFEVSFLTPWTPIYSRRTCTHTHLLLSLSLETRSFRERERVSMASFRVSNVLLMYAFVILSSIVFLISSASEEGKEYVLTLDRSNFSEIVSKHNFIVVEFYAPWYISLHRFNTCFLFVFDWMI